MDVWASNFLQVVVARTPIQALVVFMGIDVVAMDIFVNAGCDAAVESRTYSYELVQGVVVLLATAKA